MKADAAESLAGKLGFQRQNVVKFSEFGYDGQKPFMDLPEMNEDFRELACFKRKVPSDLY